LYEKPGGPNSQDRRSIKSKEAFEIRGRTLLKGEKVQWAGKKIPGPDPWGRARGSVRPSRDWVIHKKSTRRRLLRRGGQYEDIEKIHCFSSIFGDRSLWVCKKERFGVKGGEKEHLRKRTCSPRGRLSYKRNAVKKRSITSKKRNSTRSKRE